MPKHARRPAVAGGNSGTRKNLVAKEILENAAELFAERGFAATSLQEVADALGLSRTALYHYVRSKDDLLDQLVREMPSQTADALGVIRARQDVTPLERLTEAIQDMTRRTMTNPALFRLLLMSSTHLSPELRSRFRAARVAVLEHLSSMVKEAVSAGQIRPIDPDLAAFAILGMCNWSAWWYRGEQSKSHSIDEVVDVFCEIAVNGLRSASQTERTGEYGVDHALALLQADLDYLQRSLRADHPAAPAEGSRVR